MVFPFTTPYSQSISMKWDETKICFVGMVNGVVSEADYAKPGVPVELAVTVSVQSRTGAIVSALFIVRPDGYMRFEKSSNGTWIFNPSTVWYLTVSQYKGYLRWLEEKLTQVA